MDKLSIIPLKTSLVLLRISLAIIFLAHSVVRIANGSIWQFGDFMSSKGFSSGIVWVFGITAFEIIGGILLLLGYFTKSLSAGFILLLLIGIMLIHINSGWFVGEHGTGGIEYSFILIMAFLVVASVNFNKKTEQP
jgi:putative oxidoreductase